MVGRQIEGMTNGSTQHLLRGKKLNVITIMIKMQEIILSS